MITLPEIPLFSEIETRIFLLFRRFNYAELLYKNTQYQATTIKRVLDLFIENNLIYLQKEGRKNVIYYTNLGLKILLLMENLERDLNE